MKQWRNITGMVATIAAMSLSLAVAQDEPKREAGRPGPRGADRVVQNQAPPAPAKPQSQGQTSAPPNQDRVNPDPNQDRFRRNQFVPSGPMDRPQQDEHHRRGRLHPFGPRAGDWLRQYKNVPVDQQERALTNDPSFQRLPADRQEQLRQRLRQFNNLSPDRQEQLLDRMEKFEALSPEQRHRLRDIQGRMRQLSDDRQQRVKRAFQEIKGMSPEQRGSFLASSRFTTEFTPTEQEILRGLTEIENTPDLAEPTDPRSND